MSTISGASNTAGRAFAELDLGPLDHAAETAIKRGSAGGLKIIGYGDVTLVIAWPTIQPRYAVKRLPLFSSLARFNRYQELVSLYIAKLAERGVSVVPTEVRGISAADGTVRGYIIQPFYDQEVLLTSILRTCSDHHGRELLDALTGLIFGAIDPEVGIDAAVPNWALVDGRLCTFDISTPWLRDRDGKDLMDVDHLFQVYPWMVRALLRKFFFQELLDGIHEPRMIVMDTAANMIRWQNARWLDTFLELANARLDQPMTRAEVEKRSASDLKIYPLMHRLRTMDRWWQQNMRRRPYGTLLPPRYTTIRREDNVT